MRRVVWAILAAALAAAAFVVPEPDIPEEPLAFATAAVEDPGTVSAGVWYCPLASATFDVDTRVVVAAAESATATFSFPNPVPGEEADQATFSLVGADALELLVSDVVLRGDAPLFVELSSPRGGGFSVLSGESVGAGDACAASVPKTWHLPGGSTREGQRTSIRLFNPFPEVAKVTITASSDIGIEPLPELESLVVAARSWRDIPLEDTLRFRDALAITIIGEEGLVLPALQIGNDDDEAWWMGTGLSTVWEFPVARLSGTSGSVYVSNPGDVVVTVELDVLTPEGPIPSARTQLIEPGSPGVIPIDDLTDGAMGVVVRADGPIGAVAVAAGAGGLAGTTGAAQPAEAWLLPGNDPDLDSVAALWLMNSGETQATVTVRPLGATAAQTAKLLLPPGSVRRVLVEGDAQAFLIESSSPISAAWSAQSTAAATFVSGLTLAG